MDVAAGRIAWDAREGASSYQVAIEDNAGQPVWSFDSRRPEVTYDPRILEDTAGTLAVSTRHGATAEGTTVRILRRSALVQYRSTAGPPVSRGRPCAGATPCPLTDGDFSTGLSTPSTTTSTVEPQPASVTIDLGQPRNVSLVVIRGCSCQVEGSVDDHQWTLIGTSTGVTAVVPAHPSPARFVRLTGALSSLREVSVWEGPVPAPAPTAGLPSPAAAAPVATPLPAPEPSRRTPALLALAALLAAAIATAALAVRRR